MARCRIPGRPDAPGEVLVVRTAKDRVSYLTISIDVSRVYVCHVYNTRLLMPVIMLVYIIRLRWR